MHTIKRKISRNASDIVVLICGTVILGMIFCAAEHIGYFDMLRGAGTIGKIAGVILLVMIYFAIMAGILTVFVIIGNRKEKRFLKEYDSVVRDYQKTGNADRLYSRLTSIENPPVTQTQKDMVMLSLSTALYELGRKEEALAMLSCVSGSGRVGDMAREQEQKIRGKI